MGSERVHTHGPSLHPGLGRCPRGRGARRRTPARDCRVTSDVLSWGAAHNTVGISAQQSAPWPPSRGWLGTPRENEKCKSTQISPAFCSAEEVLSLERLMEPRASHPQGLRRGRSPLLCLVRLPFSR